jgi:hypothetical protein
MSSASGNKESVAGLRRNACDQIPVNGQSVPDKANGVCPPLRLWARRRRAGGGRILDLHGTRLR